MLVFNTNDKAVRLMINKKINRTVNLNEENIKVNEEIVKNQVRTIILSDK
jgi:hypothetical protein